MRLSIVVPCYNEEESIPLILEKFGSAIGTGGAADPRNETGVSDVEVILVDNGSSDGTMALLRELLPQYPFARTIRVEVNKGYGYGILQGLKVAKGDFIGWTHADLQTDPADVMKAYQLLTRRGWDPNIYVKGNRKGRSAFDQFFTMGMGIFETVYLGQKLIDVNAQPNIFPHVFYEKWENPPYDFALDLYALYMAKKNGLEVVRFPVVFPPRLHGTSHWNTGLMAKWKFIKRTFDFSRKLKKEGIH